MPKKEFDLSGKVALITGGNGGIGLGMAEALAEAGADLVIWGTNAEKNAAATEKLEAHGGKVLSQIVNVADENAVIAGFSQAVEEMGRVDSCFANAGVGGGAVPSFMEMTADQFRGLMSVNLEGVFFTLREAARHMSSREGGGSLVGMASLAAIMGQSNGQHYCASKGAVVSMMKACAVGLARYNVRANSILPGWIESDMTAGWMGLEQVQKRVLPRIPHRRWGKPEDFGGIAVYLTSDASRYHTGDTFVIDGAYSIF